MFKADKKPTEETVAPPSVIGADLRITGAMSTEGAVRVDGVVNGDVEAEVLKLEGAINGVVTADAVYLMSTARMRGDVIHAKLSVEGGAMVDGNYRQRDASDASIEARLHTAPVYENERSAVRNIGSNSTVLQGPRTPLAG
ncbi:MAG: bactofilin family protein [Alphaproteobacteria bacterium]|jgi:cytoskeletal protein CcmA (bactofilin family)